MRASECSEVTGMMLHMRYFNSTGWVAIFTGTETQIGRTCDVDGWDPTGVALVVDPERGTRRPVTDYSDFSHLEKAGQVVAVFPGGGWGACQRGRMQGDRDSAVEPVVAWLVTSIGDLMPATMDTDGRIGLFDDADRFFPPDL